MKINSLKLNIIDVRVYFGQEILRVMPDPTLETCMSNIIFKQRSYAFSYYVLCVGFLEFLIIRGILLFAGI